MKEHFGFAIVGCGMIAHVHAKCIEELPHAELQAVYASNPDKTASFAAQYGAKAYGDYHEMLSDSLIDIVAILTPSGTHAELGIQAALSGKHVIVEKPLDITLEKADSLIKICEDSGVKLCCISQHRFDPSVAALKQAVDQGLMGRLNFGSAHTKWYRDQAYYDKNWRGTWALDGGGALINQSIHYVDLLRYIMGPVEEVFSYSAIRAHERIEVEDISVSSLKFKSGAIGMIEGNTAAYPGFCTRLDIYGADGSVIIENDEVKNWEMKSGIPYESRSPGSKLKVGASGAEISRDSHKKQLEDFIAAIKEDRSPLVDGSSARETLQLILSIYDAARTGKPVRIK